MKLILGALLITLSGCQYLVRGTVQSAATQKGALVGVGYIENRDTRHSPYFARNLSDMLQFELGKKGYATATIDTTPASAGADTPKRDTKKDETADLLPANLKNAAGETRATNAQNAPGERFLSSDEVRLVAQRRGLQYLLQGAVGRSESGTLLDLEETYILFLDLYDTSGTKAASVNFTVKGVSLAEATFMRSVCLRLATAIDDQIQKKQPNADNRY